MRYLLLLLALSSSLFARQRSYGFCELGNQAVQTPTSTSTTLVQRSYPQCQVDVYQTGTTTHAPIYADNNGTVLSNPFTASTNGFWFFYADNGRYDVQLSGGGLSAPFTFGDLFPNDVTKLSQLTNDAAFCTLACIPTNISAFVNDAGYINQSQAFNPLNPVQFKNLNQVRYASQYSGSDCGAQINAAYADLPSTGGVIVIESSCSFSTPIFFSTNNKPVLLTGMPGGAVSLTYGGATGAAITLNYGSVLRAGHGIRDIMLQGPGNASSTTGLVIGGSNGARGFDIHDFTIQSFGTNLQFANNASLGTLTQGIIRDGGTNVFLPDGLSGSGENIQFNHVTFADAPTPHTNSVWIQGGGAGVEFTDCSFDQAQLRVGNGITAATVDVKGSHFENTGYATSGNVNYAFFVQDTHPQIHTSFSGTFFVQDNPTSGPSSIMTLEGGKVSMFGIRFFTQIGSPITNFAVLSNNVNVEVFGFDDLTNTISGNLLGGSTTGYVVNFSGANGGNTVARNFTMKPFDAVGSATLDVAGNIRATGGQLQSTVTTGTPPITVTSTTPVPVMTAYPVVYSTSGAQKTGTPHVVVDTIVLSSGSGSASFVGAAQFTSSATFRCAGNDATANNPVQFVLNNGSSITANGTGGDVVNFICIGQ